MVYNNNYGSAGEYTRLVQTNITTIIIVLSVCTSILLLTDI